MSTLFDTYLDRALGIELPPEEMLIGTFVGIAGGAPPGPNAKEIGRSREGRPVFGSVLGDGPRRASVIAGCHADEPAGPVTAALLPGLLVRDFPEILEQWQISLIPHINPDGAVRNRAWVEQFPDIVAYLRHSVREGPGGDIEFGFGAQPRPEAQAAMKFLSTQAPFSAHASLHGLAFGGGAWFLLCPEWVSRAGEWMTALERLCVRLKIRLHDVERHGEKGFTRIREGFCTTPNAPAMRTFFESQGDQETADKFCPSSMEFVSGLGGDPLCMVSEVPLFSIGKQSSSLENTAAAQFREALREIPPEDWAFSDNLKTLCEAYKVAAVPLATQVRLQIAMLLFGLAQVA